MMPVVIPLGQTAVPLVAPGGHILDPLCVEHAGTMAVVLADPALYKFTGGAPPSIRSLRETYRRQVVGHSADGTEAWLNWVVTDAAGDPVGYVQATVREGVAELAWVVAPSAQGRGVATGAARAVVAWLRSEGVPRFTAHIHPDHAASEAVARHLGLAPTATVVDGERRWVG